MKRGLVEPVGANADVYQARVERLRERMRHAGVEVALLYGDVYRSDDIAHLTNLCIYWNEGVVAVPTEGSAALLAKLSKRVHPWMRRTSTLTDLRASQQLPELIGAYLDERRAGQVGLVDERWWPAPLVDGIRSTHSDRAYVDMPEAVRTERIVPDALDRADIRRAGALVRAGLGAAVDGNGTPAERIAELEFAARAGGARDVIARCLPTAFGLHVECSVQFANVWAHGSRMADGDSALEAAFAAASAALAPEVTLAALQRVAGDGVLVSLISHTDIATDGDLMVPPNSADSLPPGGAFVLRVGRGAVRLADTYLLAGSSSEPLTRSLEAAA